MKMGVAHAARGILDFLKRVPEITNVSHRLYPIHRIDGDPMYTVTTIARTEEVGGTRTVAFTTTLKRAKEIVETNEGDLYEMSYRWAVIEEAWADNLYGIGTRKATQWWYQWKSEGKDPNGWPLGHYEALESPPEQYSRIVGFAF